MVPQSARSPRSNIRLANRCSCVGQAVQKLGGASDVRCQGAVAVDRRDDLFDSSHGGDAAGCGRAAVAEVCPAYRVHAHGAYLRPKDVIENSVGSALIYLNSHAADFRNPEFRPFLGEYLRACTPARPTSFASTPFGMRTATVWSTTWTSWSRAAWPTTTWTAGPRHT